MVHPLLDQLVHAFGGARRHAETVGGDGTASGMPAGSEEPTPLKLLDALRALGLEPTTFFEVLHGREEHAPFPAPLAEVLREKLEALGWPSPTSLPEISEPADLSVPLNDGDLRQRIDDRLFEAFRQVMAR